MKSIVDKAKALVGTRAVLRSTDIRKGLCCYGVLVSCVGELVEGLPSIEEVGSIRLKDADKTMAKHFQRTARPSAGGIAVFRNLGMGRRNLAEVHIAMIIDTAPITFVHADLAKGRVVAAGARDLKNLELLNYWRVA